MNFIDSLTAGSFKLANDGRTLFFPWGSMGRGYIVPSERHVAKIRWALRMFIVFGFVILLGTALTLNGYASPAALPFVIIPYVFWVRRLTGELAVSEEKLSYTEGYHRQIAATPWSVLWVFEILTLGYLFVMLRLLITRGDFRLEMLVAILILVCVAGLFAHFIRTKNRVNRKHGSCRQ